LSHKDESAATVRGRSSLADLRIGTAHAQAR
jgi:hypothetical protein